MATTPYCTRQDLINRLSATGVIDRADDGPPAELGDVIDNASTIIDEHCLLLYTPARLAVSDWVNQRATDIAASLLCERRGNPVSQGIAKPYERTMLRLEQVRLGVLSIPDIAARREAVPAMSNLRVRLDPVLRVVVERRRSAGPPVEDYQQHYDRLEFFHYGAGI